MTARRRFEGDVVAERFELSDVVALLGEGDDVAVVVVGAEVVEPAVGVGEKVPDDHQQGAADRDDGLVLPTPSQEVSVRPATTATSPRTRLR